MSRYKHTARGVDLSLIHIHVWNEKGTRIQHEYDLIMSDEYDDHYQFTGKIEGKLFEIRIMKRLDGKRGVIGVD